MPHENRLVLIREIEALRESRVITLIYSDRPISPAMIADDALRPLYDHLQAIVESESGKSKRIDLILYTRGGAVETPWKMVSKIREFCDEFSVIVPYRAHSAGTMIVLGADTVFMSGMSELGPIDPSLQIQGGTPGQFLLPDLGVEDIAAYLSFLRERAGITDQQGLTEAVKALADHLTPTLLGRMERIYSHIRLVARKILSLRRPPLTESAINAIAETLTERMYAHGHGIGVEEATTMGLPVQRMGDQLEPLVWSLFLDYEEEMGLQTTADPHAYFADESTNRYELPDALGVAMDSRDLSHVFSGTIVIERTRQIPSPLNINLNIPLNLPPSVDPQSLPQDVQQALQQMVQQGGQQIQQMVQAEIAKQAPIQSVGTRWAGGVWKRRE